MDSGGNRDIQGRRGRGGRDAGTEDRRAAGINAASEIDLGCVREPKLGRPSRRAAEVGLSFGIPLYGTPVTVIAPTRIHLQPGRIMLLLGPSGSGKSSALEQIERQFSGGCMVQRVSFPPDAAIIDAVAPGAPLGEAAGILTGCGLGEPHLWIRRFGELSAGEQFRARLARALALQSRADTAAPLLADEFCTTLHRRAARAISFNLRKLVLKHNLAAVVASCHDDVIADLQPHTIVRLSGAGRCAVEERSVRPLRAFSLRRRLIIEPGRKRDYAAFAAMHYRAGDELGFVDKVFLLREGRRGEPLGIVVYAHSPLHLALRNQATEGRFAHDPKLLNRRLRILRRLVIHPDVRGCGLGHFLVQRTLPLVGTEYVECLAAMGEFNPVFEKAGMERIGQYALASRQQAALAALRAMDVDPNAREFPLLVARRPRVRAIVARVVFDWYSGTTGGGAARVARQSPQMLAQTFRGLIGSRPVYYLWRRGRQAGRRKVA